MPHSQLFQRVNRAWSFPGEMGGLHLGATTLGVPIASRIVARKGGGWEHFGARLRAEPYRTTRVFFRNFPFSALIARFIPCRRIYVTAKCVCPYVNGEFV